MSKKPKKPADYSPRIENRKARHDYHISEDLECGIELLGSEVKSVRHGQVSLGEGFARVDGERVELFLYNVDIAMYRQAGINQHDPKRPRKLLAHKREIRRLMGHLTTKGTTLIPLAMYFSGGRVKVRIGVGTGKREHDKRHDIRKREMDREIRRGMTRKVL